MKKYLISVSILGLLLVSCTQTRTDTMEPATQTPPQAVSTDTIKDNTTNTPTVNQRYTLADIATHNSEESCWLAISGKVYDVTDFIKKHPGGRDILKGCGKDATQMFSRHPAQAKALLPNYSIGDLAQ